MVVGLHAKERGGGREGQRGERGVDKRGYSYIDRHQKSINTPQKVSIMKTVLISFIAYF